jgi:phosphoribosylpyrophosphate synthetase
VLVKNKHGFQNSINAKGIIMNFKKFTEEIRIALKEKLNREDICIYSEIALKNNHTLLPGLIIEEKGSNILHSMRA